MASEKTDDLREQMLQLRWLTGTTGIIHEFQLIQLKYWLHVVFPKAEHYGNLDVSVPDEEGNSEHIVRYHIKLGKHKPPKNLKALLTSLANSIHDLLGDEWLVQIMDGKKKIYEGIRKIPRGKNPALSLDSGGIPQKKRKQK